MVHAAPDGLDVTVWDWEGRVLASRMDLVLGQPGRMSVLRPDGATVALSVGWPGPEHMDALRYDRFTTGPIPECAGGLG